VNTRRLLCVVRVFARHRHTTGTAALAAVLLLSCGWLGASAEPVDFPLLPALKSERAINGLLLEVARNGERLVVVGEKGHILWSDDHGASWTQADVPVSLAITSVTYSVNGDAWATAHDGYLLQSTDNGATWSVKLSGNDVASLSVGAMETQVKELQAALELASDDNYEDLEWALDEAAFALEEAQLAVDEGMTTPLLKVWFDGDLGYALGAYNVFLRTVDGGATWTAQGSRLDNPDKYHLYGIARSTAGTLLVVGEAGTMLRSLDGGDSWKRVDTPYPGSFFGAVAAADGGLLAFGLRGNIYRSTDEGVSWSAVATGDGRTLMGGMASDDGTVVLVGAAGAVLQSKDSGETFRALPTEGNRVYSDVELNPDGSILVVGFGGVSVLQAESGDD
jgi:photosystem II stability/assembly factor-like uncharacterized protein